MFCQFKLCCCSTTCYTDSLILQMENGYIYLMRIYFVIAFMFLSANTVAQDSPLVVPLWENGAPGFESRKNEPEHAKDWWVRNIHNPSLTVFLPPKEIAN